MADIKSFPVKLSDLQQGVQQLVEFNPTKCLFILMDDERGISIIAPPNTDYSEMSWAMKIVDQMLVDDALDNF